MSTDKKPDKKHEVATIKAIATWGGIALGVLAFLAVGASVAAISYGRLYEGRMYPGVRILNVRVDGLTREEARVAVQTRIDDTLSRGITFSFRGEQENIATSITSTDGSESRELLQYNIDEAVNQAFSIGRSGGPLKNAIMQVGARVHIVGVPADVTIDEAGIQAALSQAFDEKLSPPKDASFDIRLATGTAPMISIQNEQTGYGLKLDDAMAKVRSQAEKLSFHTIELEEETQEPAVRRTDIESLEGDVLEMLNRPNLTFTYANASYAIPTSTLMRWIAVEERDGDFVLTLSRDAFHASIKEIAPTIEKETKNGDLDVQDGKIVSFTAGTQGVAIDSERTLAAVESKWPAESTFALQTIVTSGSLLGEDPEALGIKEIIGIGRSTFANSPSNRRKNIAKGAERVNGTIIPPGGEFSMLQALGSIDGANGWLPELVIKGNKTLPEFGGGLCQIGTTMFRAALSAGLKITERRNHSYRVVYYEPVGTDATIYEPSPDFKYKNDTNHSILVHAYIRGDEAIFEVWGTNDGRKTVFKGSTEVTDVAALKPRVYNIISPPATKLVETLDLKPGQKKCTETAHAGADAEFVYAVTYADGTTSEETFTSHYRPWQAVCLIGVEKLTAPPDTTTNESAVN